MNIAPVSVVIPTHQRAALLADAVRSVLAQDPGPLEVLVCDDASADETPEIVAGLARDDDRVRLLRTPAASGGPAVPRNLGLSQARAPWVALLDDDDRWLPGKLAAQLAHCDGLDLLAANALCRSTGRPYFPAAPDPAELPRDNVLITSTVLVRTDLLRAAGGFPERPAWHGVEDYGAWLALADLGARMAILPDCLVDYRDAGDDRFGDLAPRHTHRRLASLHGHRWLRRPLDPLRARTAASAFVTWVRG